MSQIWVGGMILQGTLLVTIRYHVALSMGGVVTTGIDSSRPREGHAILYAGHANFELF